MGNIALPESVKFAKVSFGTTIGVNSVGGHDLKLMLGPKEIALLLSFRLVCPSGLNNNFQFTWVLYRKSLPAPLTLVDIGTIGFARKDDIFAVGVLQMRTEAGSGYVGGPTDDFTFPYPLVVVRNPALWIRNIDGGADEPIMAILYYLVQKVTDEELAKLMVKDHA